MASLSRQTYPFFTAYFVDDGSTDGAAEIVKNAGDRRFTVLRQEKKGVSAARNLGLKRSDGEYLAFMDVDDALQPDYLEKLVEAAVKNQADIVLCDYIEQYGGGHAREVLLPGSGTVLTREEIQENLIPLMISGDQKHPAVWGVVWRTFVRRTFWEGTGIFFREDVSKVEDLLFLLALYNRVERIYVLRECLYRYYRYASSALNAYRPVDLEEQEIFHQIFQAVLKSEGLYQQNIGRYQANKLTMYTVAISNIARSRSFSGTYERIRQLREKLLTEDIAVNRCEYLSLLRKLSLWMLKHKMYMLLLVLYKIKETYRLRLQKYRLIPQDEKGNHVPN